MVRANLIKTLSIQHRYLSPLDVEKIVDAFFNAITTHLANGGRVEIRGFGVFTTRSRDARIGRNPRSGESVDVAAKRVPHFKPGKALRKTIDPGEKR